MKLLDLFRRLVNHRSLIEQVKRYYRFGEKFWGDGYSETYEQIKSEFSSITIIETEEEYTVLCLAIREIHRRLTTDKEIEKKYTPQSVDFIKNE